MSDAQLDELTALLQDVVTLAKPENSSPQSSSNSSEPAKPEASCSATGTISKNLS